MVCLGMLVTSASKHSQMQSRLQPHCQWPFHVYQLWCQNKLPAATDHHVDIRTMVRQNMSEEQQAATLLFLPKSSRRLLGTALQANTLRRQSLVHSPIRKEFLLQVLKSVLNLNGQLVEGELVPGARVKHIGVIIQKQLGLSKASPHGQ